MRTTKLIAVMAVSASLAFGVAAQAHGKHGKKEETVDMNSLPAEVQKTLKDKAGDSEIIRVEKETKHGKIVYEGVVKKDGKEWGILVDADGKFLKQHDESQEHKEKGEKY
jgi:uncharacterized membrane protein YkoI